MRPGTGRGPQVPAYPASSMQPPTWTTTIDMGSMHLPSWITTINTGGMQTQEDLEHRKG